MLATPVERPTPEQITKQFKVSHDDKTYVVAANRRKLLEYLLSAFEITVNKSQALSHVTSELRERSESFKELERTVTGQLQAIESIQSTARQEEQKVVALTRQCEELEKTNVEKTEEIEHLVQELDGAKVAHRSQTDTLTSRISTLTAESGAQKTSLDTVQHALGEETTRSEALKKALSALTSEREQLKTAFAEEKARAMSAEEEIQALEKAKTQSEQDLARAITGLEETSKQQASELKRLKSDLDAETSRRVLTENQVVSIRREFEQSESSYRSEIVTLNQQVGTLKEALSASSAALEHEESTTKLQKERLAVVIGEKEKTEDRLVAVSTELEQARSAVASGEQQIQSLSGNLEEAGAEKEQSEQKAKALSAALEKAEYEIEAERGQRRTIEETLERTILEHDNALGSLRQEYEDIKADLDSRNVTLAQRERDLDAITTIRVALEQELDAARTRNQVLGNDLSVAVQERDQSGQQVRTLAGELEQTNAALETERGLRRTSEEKATAAEEQHEGLGQQLRVAHEEMERAKQDQASNIRQFKEELEIAGNQIKSLEAHVSKLAREKLHAEQEVRTLSSELEHARTSLADERKSHSGIFEGDAAPGNGRPPVQQPLFRPDEGTNPTENVQLVLSKEQGLPVTVGHPSQPVTRDSTPVLKQSPVPPEDPSSGDIPRVLSGVIPRVSGISGAESLFLEPEPAAKKAGPAPEPVQPDEPAEENTVRAVSPEAPPSVDDGPQPEKVVVEGLENPVNGVLYGGQPDEIPKDSTGPVPHGDLKFNSTQWLDLLKWSHHSGSLSQEQRLKIVRMGRLIQKDRKLTNKQQDQVREILALVYSLGYRPG
jgi:chromosome segregation ATPase